MTPGVVHETKRAPAWVRQIHAQRGCLRCRFWLWLRGLAVNPQEDE